MNTLTRAEHEQNQKDALEVRMQATMPEKEYLENKEYTCSTCGTARYVQILDGGRLGCTRCHSGWTPKF